MIMLRTVFFPTLAIPSKAFKCMVSLKGDSVNQVGGILQLSAVREFYYGFSLQGIFRIHARIRSRGCDHRAGEPRS